MAYRLDWLPVFQASQALLSGLAISQEIFLISSIGATLLGLGGASLMLSRHTILRAVATGYVS